MRAAFSLCLLSLLPSSLLAATTVAPVAAAVPTVANPQGCKLLKASAYTYQLAKTGSTDASLATLLGEQGEGYAVVSAVTDKNDGNRDAGLVWHSGDELIIAFRGTTADTTDGARQMLSVEDWLNDADYAPRTDPQLGQVHAGFKAAFDNVWPGLVQQIKAWAAAGKVTPATKVYVTGHSKGGALAMLAALKLKVDKLLPVTEVDTFGAPRVGGDDFAAKYAAAGINGLRYENDQDLVPHVPLNALEIALVPLLRRVIDIKGSPSGDYVSVGKLRYVDEDGGIVTPADAAAEADMERSRITGFGSMIFDSPQDIADAIVGAHSIGSGSGYYGAVCGAAH